MTTIDDLKPNTYWVDEWTTSYNDVRYRYIYVKDMTQIFLSGSLVGMKYVDICYSPHNWAYFDNHIAARLENLTSISKTKFIFFWNLAKVGY